ncbi:MAG: hypothetical protein QOH36_898 [Actinomycetota bacterium]|nr:hypothetical protein [Actinomycetota bacterium]
MNDWYVTFGRYDPDGRSWDDARRYGFVSAGGGRWYSRTLHSLPVGARVFVLIPKAGYVGVGVVTGEAAPFHDTWLAGLDLDGRYEHASEADDPDAEEWVVPVRWLRTVSQDDAVWERGLFANQNSACRMGSRFTIETLVDHFDLGTSDE